MKLSLTASLRITAVVLILISAIYVYFGMTQGMWDTLWSLYLLPFFVWWLMNVFENYTNMPFFYRGTVPAIVILYVFVSLLTGEWVKTLIIITFVPFFILIYNAKFYPLKYSIIPIVAAFILIIYIAVGTFYYIWHPTWMMFIIVPLIPLFQRYD